MWFMPQNECASKKKAVTPVLYVLAIIVIFPDPERPNMKNRFNDCIPTTAHEFEQQFYKCTSRQGFYPKKNSNFTHFPTKPRYS